MNRAIKPVKKTTPSKEISIFQDEVLKEKNSDNRERKLFKAINFIKEEDEVVNSYAVNKVGRDFRIKFDDGRRLIWNMDSLPVDWLEVLWDYATTQRKVLSVGNRLPNEPGGLFDSKAS